ncbi:hypothetical protein LCGC14_1859000 [marine sediment metagenome]|uniref:Uncharacterized protein n=1 Tax=marine sediment metagenome TaxID=412755 RepID=A0A0F9G8C3_9ZZZZ
MIKGYLLKEQNHPRGELGVTLIIKKPQKYCDKCNGILVLAEFYLCRELGALYCKECELSYKCYGKTLNIEHEHDLVVEVRGK